MDYFRFKQKVLWAFLRHLSHPKGLSDLSLHVPNDSRHHMFRMYNRFRSEAVVFASKLVGQGIWLDIFGSCMIR